MKNTFATLLLLLNFSFNGQNQWLKHPTVDEYKATQQVKKDSLDFLISVYDKLIALNPKDDKAYFMRATAKYYLFYYPSYNYAELNGALHDYNKVIELKSKFLDTTYYMMANIKSITYGGGNCYDNLVLDDLQKAVKINPNFSMAWCLIGKCMMDDKHDYVKAIPFFTKAIETNSKNGIAYYYRGICKNKQPIKDKEGACADWNKEIELGGEGSKEDLIRNCEFTPKTAQDYYLMLTYGRLNIKDKKTELEYCNKALKLDPKFAAIYSLRASTKYSLSDKTGACTDWHTAIELGSTTDEHQIIKHCDFTPKTAKDFLDRAIYKYDKNYKAKIEDCNKAIELDTTYALAYFIRGIAKQKLGDSTSACADWKKAYQLGEKSRTYSFIYKFCEFIPTTAEDFYYRSSFYNGYKNYYRAIEDATKAIELNQKYAEAYFIRALAKSSSDNKEGACLDYKKAAELGFKVSDILIDRTCN
jgi:tetratricopeptide (TPR) repeat protein